MATTTQTQLLTRYDVNFDDSHISGIVIVNDNGSGTFTLLHDGKKYFSADVSTLPRMISVLEECAKFLDTIKTHNDTVEAFTAQ